MTLIRCLYVVVVIALTNFEMMAFRIHRVQNDQGTTSIGEKCAAVTFGRNARGYAHTYSEECFQAHDDCVVGMWPKSNGKELNAWRGHGPACCYQPTCKDLGKSTCEKLPAEEKQKCEEDCKMPMKWGGVLGVNRKLSPCFVALSMAYGELGEGDYRKGITGNKPPDIVCVKDDLTENGHPHCNFFLEQVDGRVVSELQALMALDLPIRRLSGVYENAVNNWLLGAAHNDEAAKEDACDEVDMANKEIIRIMTPLTAVTPTRPMAQMFDNMKTLFGIVQTDGGRAVELARVATQDAAAEAVRNLSQSGGHVLTGAYAVTRGLLTMYTKYQNTKRQRERTLAGGPVFRYCDLISCMGKGAHERQMHVMDPLYGQEFEGSPISCKVCKSYGLGATAPFMKLLMPFFEGELSVPIDNLKTVCAAIVPIDEQANQQSFHPPRLPNFDCFESHYSVIGKAMGLLQDAIEAIRIDLEDVADERDESPGTRAGVIGKFVEAAENAAQAITVCF